LSLYQYEKKGEATLIGQRHNTHGVRPNWFKPEGKGGVRLGLTRSRATTHALSGLMNLRRKQVSTMEKITERQTASDNHPWFSP